MNNYAKTVITATDMFCGAGGTTNGAKEAGIEVRYALNHWDRAIETHTENHPDVSHLCENIDDTRPGRCGHTTFLFASPECTNHSLAKGSKRKKQEQERAKLAPLPGILDEDDRPLPSSAEVRSRCMMYDPLRWAEKNHYKFVVLENVVDVVYWNDDEKNNYTAWLKEWDRLGYDYRECYLNSMFFPPTPQSRDRWYFVAWKKGIRPPDLDYQPSAYCVWCNKVVQAIQAWKKKDEKPWGRYGKRNGQYVYACEYCMKDVTPYYYCAANAIDWSIPGQRIGDRRQPLEAKTMDRIRYGLDMFRGSPSTTQSPSLFDEGFQVQSTDNGYDPRVPFLLNLSHAGKGYSYVSPMDQPMATQTTRQEIGIAFPPSFLFEMSHAPNLTEMYEPFDTQTTYDDRAIVQMPFVMDHLGEYRPRDITRALSTVVADGNHQSVIMPPHMPSLDKIPAWFLTYYSNGKMYQAYTHVCPTMPTDDRCGIVTSDYAGASIDIMDCSFRMMLPYPEISRAMAFDDGYRVKGTRKEQVKQYGNATTKPVIRWLAQQCVKSLD